MRKTDREQVRRCAHTYEAEIISFTVNKIEKYYGEYANYIPSVTNI